MQRTNQTLRDTLKKHRIPLWRVAEGLGISEWTLGRWLRHEIDEELDLRIRAVVDSILSSEKED